MSMTEGEIKTFWSGVMAAQNGKVLLMRNKNGYADIVNITFREGYLCDILLANGDLYIVTEIEMSDNGRITGAYVKKGDVEKYIPCTYNDSGHLISVGVVSVCDIDKLGLEDITYRDGNVIRW